MPNKFQTLQDIELDLIKNDLEFYTGLVFELSKHESIGILFFGLAPYLSLFKFETYKYFRDNFPNQANFISGSKNFDDITRASRMRIKFFDDSTKRIEGVLELLEWIRKFHEWHINQHRGLLAPLKRALQDDFGVFLYDSHVIGSTHTGLFNLGYEKATFPTTNKDNFKILGEMSKSFGFELGEYFGTLTQLPQFTFTTQHNYCTYGIEDRNLKYKDEKSYKFLNSIFNETNAEDINLGFLILLTTVNFFQYIIKRLVIGSPITVFKLKFITLYHLESSLGKLQDYFYPKKLLTNRSKEYIQAILKDKDLKLIKSKTKFRNILVHYKIENLPTETVNSTIDFYRLTEHFFQGMTYSEVDQILDAQIQRISTLFDEWLNWSVRPSQLRNW